MQRTVTTPADLGGAALDDLKGWLGISRPHEDTLLLSLLGASVGICEAFTGQSPIQQTVEERIDATSGPHWLSTRPVRSFASADLIGEDNDRYPLEHDQFEFKIDTNQTACVILHSDQDSPAVIVSFKTGLAKNWSEAPDALKQGIIRLAAFHYRDRETGREASPPVSVAALWRPWRLMRLT